MDFTIKETEFLHKDFYKIGRRQIIIKTELSIGMSKGGEYQIKMNMIYTRRNALDKITLVPMEDLTWELEKTLRLKEGKSQIL